MNDVDALVVEIGVELLNLLLTDLGLLEPRLDLIEGQVTRLLSLRDQWPQLLQFHDRSVIT